MVRFTFNAFSLDFYLFISGSFLGALAAQFYEYSIACYVGVDTYQVQAKMRPTALPY